MNFFLTDCLFIFITHEGPPTDEDECEEFECSDGVCLPHSQVCDYSVDCGDDEVGCDGMHYNCYLYLQNCNM